MADHVKAWQCIGCGNIEAPQTCIGVCEYRKVEFVYAAEHEEVRAQLARTTEALHALQALLSQLAHTTPRDEGFKASYLAVQRKARELLARAEHEAGAVAATARSTQAATAAPAAH